MNCWTSRLLALWDDYLPPVFVLSEWVKVAQSIWLCDLMDYIVHGILHVRILEWVAAPLSRGSSHSGIEPRSSALQVDCLPAEPPGKPRNPGVDSLSLLQGIFWPRNRTGVSCIACVFLTGWAPRTWSEF